jgi:hypothetical protein
MTTEAYSYFTRMNAALKYEILADATIDMVVGVFNSIQYVCEEVKDGELYAIRNSVMGDIRYMLEVKRYSHYLKSKIVLVFYNTRTRNRFVVSTCYLSRNTIGFVPWLVERDSFTVEEFALKIQQSN